jgi:hypothetical protein
MKKADRWQNARLVYSVPPLPVQTTTTAFSRANSPIAWPNTFGCATRCSYLTTVSLAAAPRLLLQTVQRNASGLQEHSNEGTVPVGLPFNLDACLQQGPVVADSNSSKDN